MTQSATDAERLALDYLETIWNDRSYAKIPEYVSPWFVMYDPAAIDDKLPGPRGVVRGPEDLETFVRGVVAGFPDFHVEVHDVFSDSELVLYAGTLSMTHTGTFCWIPPTGRTAEVRYMGAIRVADDRVSEHRVFPPLMEIAEQLGFTSPTILPYLPKLAWAWLAHGIRSR